MWSCFNQVKNILLVSFGGVIVSNNKIVARVFVAMVATIMWSDFRQVT